MTTRRRPRSSTAPRSVAPAARSPWSEGLTRYAAIAGLLLVMLAVTVVRVRLAGIPLERDEGEYAYAGQLILQGVPPYAQAYNMKFPGTYYAYAALMAVFGQTPWGIRIGLLLVNLVTTALLYRLGRRFLPPPAAAAAAAAFAILSLDRWIMGVWAHATHFVVLPLVAGLIVLSRARTSDRATTFAGGGALIGLAVLMKQHAIVFAAFALLLVWRWGRERNARETRLTPWARLGAFASGATLPFAIVIVVFAAQGVLGKFWFWTFSYAREYVSELSWSDAAEMFGFARREITTATWPFWLLAAIGLVAIWTTARWRAWRLFLTGLVAASSLAVCPGFFFRQHYFILTLPAAALLIGVAIDAIAQMAGGARAPLRASIVAGLVVALPLGIYVADEQAFLLSMTGREIMRARYSGNPFVEAPDIARYIEGHTDPADRIAVIGSEPEIYFYAHRRAATGYIYTYPLVEPQPYASRMQTEMMEEIEAVHPKYVVFPMVTGSWAVSPSADRRILVWTGEYTSQCYTLVGIADIYSLEATTMVWDDAARHYQPRSPNVVYTYVRKSDAMCRVGQPPR